ncbi:hypothetical protein MNBD_NITROSPINAE04-1598 [hydrothermal vent metagenome]|uniref:Outer membrane protein beta-barrel domain-containing protein n=1 Tax=hydrothermal vent metagenome TaxID=652676 RepID=A0A3B1CCB6_9ZZZZ
MNVKTLSVILLYLLIFASNAQAAEKSGWMTMEYQSDSRNFNTLNVTGASSLPGGFSISGFTDLEGRKGLDRKENDIVTFFTEIRVKTKAKKYIGLIAEINVRSGTRNDIGRLGFYFQPKWDFLKKNKIFFFAKALPVETDEKGGQLSFAWNVVVPKIFDGRLSLGGYYDYNIKSGPDEGIHVVSDTQFRFRLIEDLSLLVEYRYNGYLSSKNNGVGTGLQYRF